MQRWKVKNLYNRKTIKRRSPTSVKLILLKLKLFQSLSHIPYDQLLQSFNPVTLDLNLANLWQTSSDAQIDDHTHKHRRGMLVLIKGCHQTPGTQALGNRQSVISVILGNERCEEFRVNMKQKLQRQQTLTDEHRWKVYLESLWRSPGRVYNRHLEVDKAEVDN